MQVTINPSSHPSIRSSSLSGHLCCVFTAEVVVLPPPKDDLYGLEFDPVQHAPEMAAFRAS
eukprot:38101-Eustigmatos_ZCMA.PRE.1